MLKEGVTVSSVMNIVELAGQKVVVSDRPMKTCDELHPPIAYQGILCPLCHEIEHTAELEALVKNVQQLNSKVLRKAGHVHVFDINPETWPTCKCGAWVDSQDIIREK